MVLQFDMTQSPSSEHGSSHHAGHGNAKKKRVGKACDSCRIKKTKCDGKKPCSRCILDNKICVFTEKRKQREKSHPLGYVELLETRLDILTKSLEKLVELSTPHLAFLQQLVAEHEAKKIQNGQNGQKGVAVKHESDSNDELSDYHSDDEDDRSDENDLSSDSAVPINKVVEYLINKESLLSTLPVEWERGALIAANFNARDLESSAKLFAEHRTNVNDNEDAKPGSGSKSGGYYKSSNYLFNSAAPSTSQSSLNETSNFSIGVNNSAGLQSGAGLSIDPHHVSDVDSDSNTVGTASSFRKLQTRSTNASLTTEPESPPGLEGFSKKANSLFINSDTNNSNGLINVSSNNSSRSNSSITSLTTKFENQGIRSPTLSPEDPGLANSNGRQILLRRASSHRSGLSSKSAIKSSSGHVHKRPHPPRNDSFKNAADLLGKRRSSSSHESFPQFNNNHPAQYEKINEVVPSYDKLRYDSFDGSSLEDFGSITYSELPSEAFKLNANSPTSLFENPINNASLFNAAMSATVEPNHINSAPNPTEMLEEDGFHFLSSSPYNIA